MQETQRFDRPSIENMTTLSAGGDTARDASATLSPESFKAAFRRHPAGVALITADAGRGPVALTATSVFSVSAVPPLLVFSISELSSSAPEILRAKTVVVHLLGAAQLDLAVLGATSGIDRFADRSIWKRMAGGEPFFPAADAWIRGAIVNTVEAGASTLVVVSALETSEAEPTELGVPRPEPSPLVYVNRTWHQLDGGSRIA